MPDVNPSNWISELTLAGLLAYILISSQRKQWYWAHYVQELHERLKAQEAECSVREVELKKDAEDWKRMAIDLLKTQRKLVESEQATKGLHP